MRFKHSVRAELQSSRFQSCMSESSTQDKAKPLSLACHFCASVCSLTSRDAVGRCRRPPPSLMGSHPSFYSDILVPSPHGRRRLGEASELEELSKDGGGSPPGNRVLSKVRTARISSGCEYVTEGHLGCWSPQLPTSDITYAGHPTPQ